MCSSNTMELCTANGKSIFAVLPLLSLINEFGLTCDLVSEVGQRIFMYVFLSFLLALHLLLYYD